MIQFNLLPDVKVQHIKIQRLRQMLTTVSIAASVIALGVLVVLLVYVYGVQKKSLHDEAGDITQYSNQLQNIKGLDKILTVQNQLNTLPSLYDGRPAVSRLFTYLSQVTPPSATLNQLHVDFTASTISVGGTAPSLDAVSNYTDNLKVSQYTLKGISGSKPAFSQVVLSSFGRSSTGASFTITLSFDPAIFAAQNDVTLAVPSGANAGQSNIFGAGN